MLEGMKRRWHALRQGTPGRRFRDEYEKRHAAGSSPARKLLFIGGGALVLAAGIFFLPAPGPGMVIVAFGAALMARESWLAARALDWTERQLRAGLHWLRRTWQGAGAPLRAALVALAVLTAAGGGYLAWRVLFG